MTDTTSASSGTSKWPKLGFGRRRDDRIVSGLAAGIAQRLGVDTTYVRAAFVLSGLASGVGAILYGLGWLATIDEVEDPLTGGGLTSSDHQNYRNAGFALATLGGLLLLNTAGLWPSSTLMWTAILITYGSATIWARSDAARRARMASVFLATEEGRRSRRDLTIRVLVGGALIVAGLVFFFVSNANFRSLGFVVLSAVTSLAGLSLVAGPWVFQLWRQLGDERTERIRSDERTEVAAHLHDSVLQTLALIQGSNDPEEQAVLARIQERELRTWMFEGNGNGTDLFANAIEEMSADVERTHQIAIEAVTVGDLVMDPALTALVAAGREALVNVARHSGVRRASLFAEVGQGAVDLFVSDQGSGFDPGEVDADRRGIAESIVGRMQRHGGTAIIDSTPGEGTEIHLSLPRIRP